MLYFNFLLFVQALAELLPSLANDGHRVLIFSQWTTMLDILEWTLEVIGVTYRRLDGGLVLSSAIFELNCSLILTDKVPFVSAPQ